MNVQELLSNPDAVLDTTDLAALGYSRRQIDVIYREAMAMSGVEKLPGFKRKTILVRDLLVIRERYTYRGDRVIPA